MCLFVVVQLLSKCLEKGKEQKKVREIFKSANNLMQLMKTHKNDSILIYAHAGNRQDSYLNAVRERLHLVRGDHLGDGLLLSLNHLL